MNFMLFYTYKKLIEKKGSLKYIFTQTHKLLEKICERFIFRRRKDVMWKNDTTVLNTKYQENKRKCLSHLQIIQNEHIFHILWCFYMLTVKNVFCVFMFLLSGLTQYLHLFSTWVPVLIDSKLIGFPETKNQSIVLRESRK